MASIRHILGITIGLSVIALLVGADSSGLAQELSQFPNPVQVATETAALSEIRDQVQADDGLQNNLFLSNGDGGFLSNDSLTQRPFQAGPATGSFGSKLYRPNDDFNEGLVIRGNDAAMKIGGYVKLDLIYDFNAIDSTDLFDVGSIPIGAPPRTNSRMHVRQSRVNFDTRWKTDAGNVRTFVEADFFSEGDQFRLRHAYGKLGKFLGGQTWTTFANIDASPATLDFEGSVSTISPRRAQIRWTQPLYNDQWSLALALEDSTTEIELAPGTTITGEERTISPDFVFRLRRTHPEGNMQFAGIVRKLGFQPTGEPIKTADAWGLNFSQVNKVGPIDRVYWQINYGDGIASLVGGLPDIAPTGPDTAALLGYFGWMVGATHTWNDKLASNLTFAESHFQNTSGQPSTDINNLTYLAANLIWSPLDQVDVGIEYLYGKREDISGASGLANRIQFSIFYYLP